MKWIALFAVCLALPMAGFAGQTESEAALTKLLFDEDMENVSYSLRSDGFVDILFGPAVSDEDYSRILNKLRAHPDIPGVLAGRGRSNFCPVK
jgi:hypothetical protein